MDIDQLLCVQTTAESKAAAQAIGTYLVEQRLAACVQILGPISSTYWWQGGVEHSEEWLCVAKTDGKRFESVKNAIVERHRYDVPEIIATPIVAGSSDYLHWLRRELDPDQG